MGPDPKDKQKAIDEQQKKKTKEKRRKKNCLHEET